MAKSRWLQFLIISVLLLLSGPPLIAVALISVQDGFLTAAPTWTLKSYYTVMQQLGPSGPVLNTLIFSLGSTCVTLVLGGFLAFVVERTNTPLRSLGYMISLGLLAIPGAVYAISWTLMFSRSGLMNKVFSWFFGLFGQTIEPISIANLGGMIAIEGMSWVPLAFLMLVGPLRSMDGALEDAAFASGASRFQVLTKITGPLLVPAIAGIGLLTFVRGLEAFAIPAIIGRPGNIQVVTTEIYSAVVQEIPPDYGIGAAYGCILVAVVAVLFYFYGKATSRARQFATLGGKGFRPRRIELGSVRYLLSVVIVLYILVIIVLPLVTIFWASLQSFYSGPNFRNLSFQQYRRLFDYPQVVRSFGDSLIVGASVAFCVMALTFLAAWTAIRGKAITRQIIELSVSFPLVLPGIVLGLALLQIYANLPIPIYGTIAALIVAGITRFIPFGYRYAHAGLLQIQGELEEAALASGASQAQVVRHVVAPLVALPLLAGFLYVFLISARELEASVFLVTAQTPMVAPALINIFEDGSIPLVAAFSTIITLFFGGMAYALYLLGRRYGISLSS